MKNTMSKIDNVIQSKWCLTIIVLLLLSAKTMAQIPNGGFEDWTTVGNCEEPTSWYSTNLFDTTGSNYPSTKSTDHYPLAVGNYSVRLANDTALYKAGGISNQKYLGCGLIMTTKIDRIDRPSFPISGHPTSLRVIINSCRKTEIQ